MRCKAARRTVVGVRTRPTVFRFKNFSTEVFFGIFSLIQQITDIRLHTCCKAILIANKAQDQRLALNPISTVCVCPHFITPSSPSIACHASVSRGLRILGHSGRHDFFRGKISFQNARHIHQPAHGHHPIITSHIV